MSGRALIQLQDKDLFGNEAAEDEDEDTFNAYVYERPELAAFVDEYRKLCFVRAFKGEGKSALLRHAQQRVRRQGRETLVVDAKGPAISPLRTDDDFDAWTRDWKASLIAKVGEAVGAKLDFAFSDQAMALVELADRNGVREKGLIAAVLSRCKFSFSVSSGSTTAKAELAESTKVHTESVVKRWADGKEPIWIFVDDVDQNFTNDSRSKAKIAAFFHACRQLSQAIPELRIRAAIRPNVWTILKYQHESLSHVEQYVTDLVWSEASIRALVAKRIEGYLVRRSLMSEVIDSLPTESISRERKLIALVFEEPMSWGHKEVPPHLVLYTLSKHRPRWVVELSSAAAHTTMTAHRNKILSDDVFKCLEAFGKRRIADTVAEFRSQCSDVEELIASLKQGEEEYSTDQLIDHLRRHVTEHLSPRISGILGPPKPIEVAAFLFEIGLIFGRRDFSNGEYEHIGFSDDPSLLRSRTNVDDGLRWEVHPVFRQALGVRDDKGMHSPSGAPRRRVVATRSRPPN